MVELSDDGKLLATGEPDGMVRLWNVAELAAGADIPLMESRGDGEHRTTALALSRDRRLLACARGTSGVEVWDVGVRRLIGTFADTPNELRTSRYVSAIAFSPDGRQLAVCRGQSIQLWNLANEHSAALFTELSGHRGTVTGIAYSPDGDVIATSGSDGHIKLFSSKVLPRSRQVGASFPAAAWECGSFSEDGSRYFFVDEQGLVTEINVATLTIANRNRWEALGGRHTQALVLRGRQLLGVGTEDGRLKIVDIDSQELVTPPIAAAADGGPIVPWMHLDRHDLLVLSDLGRRGALIDTRSWRKIDTTMRLRHSTFWDVSHDRRYAFTAREDGTLGVHRIDRTGAFLDAAHAKAQTAATASPLVDGRSLAIAYTEKGSVFWDVTRPEKPRALDRKVRMEFAARFSPDGKRLATNADGLTLWDVETGLPVMRLPTRGAVSRIRFSPNGKAMAAGCGGKLINRYWVHLWRSE